MGIGQEGNVKWVDVSFFALLPLPTLSAKFGTDPSLLGGPDSFRLILANLDWNMSPVTTSQMERINR